MNASRLLRLASHLVARSLCGGVLALVIAACEDAPTHPEVRHVAVEIATAHGEPVPDANIELDRVPQGTSDEQGRLELSLETPTGDSVEPSAHELTVHCPAGYSPESSTRRLVATTTVDLQERPVAELQRIECNRSEVLATLVVRTPGASGVPVFVQGTQVGSTGEDSLLHYVARGAPGTDVTVSLGLDELTGYEPPLASTLRQFRLADDDTLMTLDVPFEKKPPPARPRRPSPRPKRWIPRRLD